MSGNLYTHLVGLEEGDPVVWVHMMFTQNNILRIGKFLGTCNSNDILLLVDGERTQVAAAICLPLSVLPEPTEEEKFWFAARLFNNPKIIRQHPSLKLDLIEYFSGNTHINHDGWDLTAWDLVAKSQILEKMLTIPV